MELVLVNNGGTKYSLLLLIALLHSATNDRLTKLYQKYTDYPTTVEGGRLQNAL